MIWLVRHGQASWGAADYDVLSPLGHEQAQVVGRTLAGLGVEADAVLSGRMRRQRDTAQGLVAGAGWPVAPTVDAAFDEFDHGHVLERLPAEELPGGDRTPGDPPGNPLGHSPDNLPGADLRARQLRLSIQRWISGEADADYHETFAEFLHRVGAGIERVREHRSAVVATSGGAIAATAACLLLPGARPSDLGPIWLRLNWVLTNASITRVRATDSALHLVSFNEHGHLVGNLRTHV